MDLLYWQRLLFHPYPPVRDPTACLLDFLLWVDGSSMSSIFLSLPYFFRRHCLWTPPKTYSEPWLRYTIYNVIQESSLLGALRMWSDRLLSCCLVRCRGRLVHSFFPEIRQCTSRSEAACSQRIPTHTLLGPYQEQLFSWCRWDCSVLVHSLYIGPLGSNQSTACGFKFPFCFQFQNIKTLA